MTRSIVWSILKIVLPILFVFGLIVSGYSFFFSKTAIKQSDKEQAFYSSTKDAFYRAVGLGEYADKVASEEAKKEVKDTTTEKGKKENLVKIPNPTGKNIVTFRGKEYYFTAQWGGARKSKWTPYYDSGVSFYFPGRRGVSTFSTAGCSFYALSIVASKASGRYVSFEEMFKIYGGSIENKVFKLPNNKYWSVADRGCMAPNRPAIIKKMGEALGIDAFKVNVSNKEGLVYLLQSGGAGFASYSRPCKDPEFQVYPRCGDGGHFMALVDYDGTNFWLLNPSDPPPKLPRSNKPASYRALKRYLRSDRNIWFLAPKGTPVKHGITKIN